MEGIYPLSLSLFGWCVPAQNILHSCLLWDGFGNVQFCWNRTWNPFLCPYYTPGSVEFMHGGTFCLFSIPSLPTTPAGPELPRLFYFTANTCTLPTLADRPSVFIYL